MLVPLPLPKTWDVVRCFLDYPNDKSDDATHPALVLAAHEADKFKKGSPPLVVVAGGTGVFDLSCHPPKRRRIRNGEIPLKLGLCLGAGLSKETKFCFAEEGIVALPWEIDFFRCDPRLPHANGEPIFGSLNQMHRDFASFRTILLPSPEYRNLKASMDAAVRAVLL